MSPGLPAALAAAAGLLAGAAHFLGLRWSVRRVLAGARSQRWLLAGFVARLALLMAALVVAAQGHWERLLAALAGVLLARALVFAGPRRTAGLRAGRAPEGPP